MDMSMFSTVDLVLLGIVVLCVIAAIVTILVGIIRGIINLTKKGKDEPVTMKTEETKAAVAETGEATAEEADSFGAKGALKWFLYGLPMGVAHIIPGVSGGTLALILGYFEEYIDAIKNLFKTPKKSLKRLLPLILGVGIAMFGLSQIIDPCLEKFLFPTIMLFVGAILGGLPLLIKDLKGSKTTGKDIFYCLLAAGVTIGMLLLSMTSSSVTDTHLTVGKWLLIWFCSAISGAIIGGPGRLRFRVPDDRRHVRHHLRLRHGQHVCRRRADSGLPGLSARRCGWHLRHLQTDRHRPQEA